MPKPQFWEDAGQAQERLSGTIVSHEGRPFYVRSIEPGEDYDDNMARVFGFYAGAQNGKEVPMDDKGFQKFRVLPTLGWGNYEIGSHLVTAHLARKATRSRSHGLSSNNTKVLVFSGRNLVGCRDYNAETYMRTQSFSDIQTDPDNTYPPLAEILLAIRENSAIAYSPKFCVFRCENGVRWLYRGSDRIGMFSGANTLSLFPKLGFYREEIAADPKFTLDTIQEF